MASNDTGFGLGLILGQPTGISAKYYLDPTHAIDGALAYSFGNYVLIYADYLWHYPRLFGTRDRFLAQLTGYLGVGGVFAAGTGVRTSPGSSDIGVGVRVPFGLEWRPNDPPIGVFVEIAPGIGLDPAVNALLEGGIGIRYYF